MRLEICPHFGGSGGGHTTRAALQMFEAQQCRRQLTSSIGVRIEQAC